VHKCAVFNCCSWVKQTLKCGKMLFSKFIGSWMLSSLPPRRGGSKDGNQLQKAAIVKKP